MLAISLVRPSNQHSQNNTAAPARSVPEPQETTEKMAEHLGALPPAPLTFARVCTEDTRLEFAHIASIVFSLPFGTSKRIYGATGLWESPSYGWVGYFKGKAVAIVTIVIASDAIGVYSLGTLPEYQGRGFGETLLRHAIDDASQRTGLRRSVLQSTQQGINLYLRLGYRIVTNFSIYVREGCASF